MTGMRVCLICIIAFIITYMKLNPCNVKKTGDKKSLPPVII